MGSGSSGDATTKTEPWGPQKPYLKDVLGQAQQLYQQGGPQISTEPWTAPFNPTQVAAQNAATNYATGQAPAIAGQAGQAFATTSNPALMLDPNNNPYLAQYAKGAVQPIYDQLNQTTLPAITNSAFGSHLVGSNREGIAQGLAIQGADRAAGDVTSNIYSTAYGQGLDSLLKSEGLAPTVQGTGLTGANVLGAVGQQQNDLAQAELDQANQTFNYNQQLPWNTLAAYQNLVQGNYGGTTTADTGGQDQNPLLQLLGGGLSGAAVGSTFGGPVGAGVGGGLGALLALLG